MNVKWCLQLGNLLYYCMGSKIYFFWQKYTSQTNKVLLWVTWNRSPLHFIWWMIDYLCQQYSTDDVFGFSSSFRISCDMRHRSLMDCCSLKSTHSSCRWTGLSGPVQSVHCPVTFSILVRRLEFFISVSEDLNRGTVHCPAESRPSSCTQVYSFTTLNDTKQSVIICGGPFAFGMLINPTTLLLSPNKLADKWTRISIRRPLLSFSYSHMFLQCSPFIHPPILPLREHAEIFQTLRHIFCYLIRC